MKPALFSFLLIFSTCSFAQSPKGFISLIDIGQTFLKFKFEKPSDNIKVNYGLTKNLEIKTSDFSFNPVDNTLTLYKLFPACFYYISISATQDDKLYSTPITMFATKSKSSGTIKAYFNNTVDNSISAIADGIQIPDFTDTLIAYINKSLVTLDVCVFDNRRDQIVTAINNAYLRGVQVRLISENTNLNTSLTNLNAAIPVLKRQGTATSGYMHNKFVIIDADNTENAWVLTGSANHTPDNLTEDPNNIIFIQDQSLALAYRIEFNEMWGSTDAIPNVTNSKFGADKTDNTPHLFNIGGKNVESYFSPSDGTTSHIVNTLTTANTDIEFATFTFTHNDLGDIVRSKYNSGISTKGIIDNISYFGSEYSSLLSNGVSVISHAAIPTSFHHKYGIVDATNIQSDPVLITGSHNWTNSAEDDYDENTLIVHDATIANMYYEEFMTRYNEMTTSYRDLKNLHNITIYPVPTGDYLIIEYSNITQENISINFYNSSGLLISTKNELCISGKNIYTVNTSQFSAGLYMLTIINEKSLEQVKFIKY